MSEESKILGIKSPILPGAYDILLDAIGKDWDSSELNKALIILRYYDPEDAEAEGDKDLDEIRDFIFDKKQIVNLDETNWPKHPLSMATPSTSSDKIHAVVTFSVDSDNWTLGVKGPLTSYQEDALYDAIGTYWGTPKMDKAALITRFWALENAEEARSPLADEVRYSVLPKDRVVNLNKENWPRYPVLVFSYTTDES